MDEVWIKSEGLGLFLHPHRPLLRRVVDAILAHVTVNLHRRGGACRVDGVHSVQA